MQPLAAAIRDALWRPELAGRPGVVRFAVTVARYLYALLRDVFTGQLTLRAMSLVYITLLSAVPLLAFSFSLIKVFGVHNSLRPQLYRLMDPLGTRGVEITDAVIRAVDGIEGGVLGPLSLAFLIYTAVAMVQEVEGSFNHVWQVNRPRSLARRLTEYITVLLIGPVVVATAMGLIAAVSSDTLLQRIAGIEPFGTFILWAGQITPYVLIMAAFTFLYRFIPNTMVRLVPAATGGAIAGAAWSFVGAVFASIVAVSGARSAIYSTFAVAVSALIWLYVSWLILLLGAQIAFYAQNPEYLRIGRQEPAISNGLRERIALNVMYLIGLAFSSGSSRCTLETITATTRIPGRALDPVIRSLEKAGLISVTQDEALVPGRDMSRITLADILATVRGGGETGSLEEPAWSGPVDRVADRLDAAIAGLTAGTTLAALTGRGEVSGDSPGAGPPASS